MHSHAQAHTVTQSHSHTVTQPHSHTVTQSHSHTHTITHTVTHSHTQTHRVALGVLQGALLGVPGLHVRSRWQPLGSEADVELFDLDL